MVIASGTSDRHVQSITELVADELKHGGATLLGKEGLREGQWALLDLGSVIVHVFHQFTRQVYDLEGLWRSAPRVALTPASQPAHADRRR